MIDSYVLVQKALRGIYSHSIKNEEEIKKSLVCHCIQCTRVFASSMVTAWESTSGTRTAVCPMCKIGSVIGDASGVVMTDSLLKEMNTFWYEAKFLGDDFDYEILSETWM